MSFRSDQKPCVLCAVSGMVQNLDHGCHEAPGFLGVKERGTWPCCYYYMIIVQGCRNMGKDIPQGPKVPPRGPFGKALLKRELELALCRHIFLQLMLLRVPLIDPCAVSSIYPNRKNPIYQTRLWGELHSQVPNDDGGQQPQCTSRTRYKSIVPCMQGH